MDEAHRRIRNLSPITISISLKHIKAELVGKDLHKYLLKWRHPSMSPLAPSVPMAGGPAGLLIGSNGDSKDNFPEFIPGIGALAEFKKIQFFILHPSRLSTLSQADQVFFVCFFNFNNF